MRKLTASATALVFVGVMLGAAIAAEPKMLLDGNIAVTGGKLARWSEGGFLVLNQKDLLLVVTGYDGGANHDSSPASIYLFRSHDGGLNWTPQDKAQLVQDPKDLGLVNVMSAGLLQLPDNELLLYFGGYKKGRVFTGPYLRRSKDLGKTWSKPRLICKHGAGIAMPGRAFILPGGRIIMPAGRRFYDGKTQNGAGTFYSDDNGKTWQESNRLSYQGKAMAEPTVVALEDGRLMVFLRNTTGQILKSYSNDKGQSWGPVLPTGIPCGFNMASLTRLQNGDLLLVYNFAKPEKVDGPWPRWSMNTLFSKDEGMTWSGLREFTRVEAYKSKITMASVALVGEDRVVVAFSQSPSTKNLYDYRLYVFNLDWLYAGTRLSDVTNPDKTALPKGKKWKLIWNDEFDGSKLDESKWEYLKPDMSEHRIGYLAKDAVYLDGKGHLAIKVYEKEGKYCSGIIQTKGKFEHKYGYWLARCKLPKQEGHWPAFWICSPVIHDPNMPGTEIDIMEYPTIQTDKIHHNLHWYIGGDRKKHQHAGHTGDIPGVSEGFHTFGVEWTPKEYVFYVDGKVTWRTPKGISHRDEYILLSEEIGPWGGKIKNAKLPDLFEVDYVRVYEMVK